MLRTTAFMAFAVFLTGCAFQRPQNVFGQAQISPQTPSAADIAAFPKPLGKIPVAVYSFKDQTGQYKSSPSSSFSTAVTQGATAILIKALKDSDWFLPMERENLQDILTERKIARAIEQPAGEKGGVPAVARTLPPLMSANLIIEGSIVGYDENVKSGGIGAKYFGISLSQQYRVDQVSVNLRAIDVNTGQILESVSTSKTVYSILLDSGFYRFVTFRKLLEAEVGITETEPAAICVEEAIRAGLGHLISRGVKNGLWTVLNPADVNAPILQKYLFDYQKSVAPKNAPAVTPVAAALPNPVTPPSTVEPTAAASSGTAPPTAPVSATPADGVGSTAVAPTAPSAEPKNTDSLIGTSAPAEDASLIKRRGFLEKEAAEACTLTPFCKACKAGRKSKQCSLCTAKEARCQDVTIEIEKIRGESQTGQPR